MILRGSPCARSVLVVGQVAFSFASDLVLQTDRPDRSNALTVRRRHSCVYKSFFTLRRDVLIIGLEFSATAFRGGSGGGRGYTMEWIRECGVLRGITHSRIGRTLSVGVDITRLTAHTASGTGVVFRKWCSPKIARRRRRIGREPRR